MMLQTVQTAVESPITVTIHIATLGGIVTILGVLLKQHKVWTRMKDRCNTLWAKHCMETKELFIPLDNGK